MQGNEEIDFTEWPDSVDSDSDWIVDEYISMEVELQPDDTKEEESVWAEVPKSVSRLKECFPKFTSHTVLYLEQHGLPKDVAVEVIDYLIPYKIGDLASMKLWESVSNCIADSGYYELLQYFLLDLDIYHTRRINNQRNLLKAVVDHNVELLKIMIKKYEGRTNVAMHFEHKGWGNPMPGRVQNEFDIVMLNALEHTSRNGFFEGMKIIDRSYFGSYKTVIGKALDAKHKNEEMIEFILSKPHY